MKKMFGRSLAFALLASFAASSMAQKSEIYGIADVYAGSVRGSVSSTVVNDGGNAPSRLGFRGREDLGGGLSAHYVLEMGFTADTGASAFGGGFGRQSFVGLSGPWGTVEAGRQYTPLFFNLLATVPFGMNANWAPVQLANSMDGQPASVRALGAPLRQSNMLRYRYGGGVNAKGLRVDLAVAPGEGAAASGNVVAVGASYRGDAYFLGYAAQRIESGTGTAIRFHNELQALSASYRMGDLTLSANHMVFTTTFTGGRRTTHIVLGAAYEAGPHRWMIEANRRDLKGSPNDAVVTTVGYDYGLSKRSAIYARVLYLSNRGTAANTMALATVNAGSGANVRGIALGMRHNF